MNDKDEEGSPGSVDAAIEACSQNIGRNIRSSMSEAVVAIVLLGLVGSFVLAIAKKQGEENDQKRQVLRAELTDATTNLERLAGEGLSLDHELRRAVDASKDAKPDSQEALEVKFFQSRVERSTEQRKVANEERIKAVENINKHKSPPLLTDAILYGAAALFVVLIGLLAGLYRQHVREVTRNEQMRIGFHRIRIAANNASLPGFGTEVRVSLTQGAFDSTREDAATRGKKIESPLPGHPGSDISSAVLNRFLEQVDIILKPKAK